MPGSAAATTARTTIAMRRFFFIILRGQDVQRGSSTQTAAGISKMMPMTNIIVISNG